MLLFLIASAFWYSAKAVNFAAIGLLFFFFDHHQCFTTVSRLFLSSSFANCYSYGFLLDIKLDYFKYLTPDYIPFQNSQDHAYRGQNKALVWEFVCVCEWVCVKLPSFWECLNGNSSVFSQIMNCNNSKDHWKSNKISAINTCFYNFLSFKISSLELDILVWSALVLGKNNLALTVETWL